MRSSPRRQRPAASGEALGPRQAEACAQALDVMTVLVAGRVTGVPPQRPLRRLASQAHAADDALAGQRLRRKRLPAHGRPIVNGAVRPQLRGPSAKVATTSSGVAAKS